MLGLDVQTCLSWPSHVVTHASPVQSKRSHGAYAAWYGMLRYITHYATLEFAAH